MIQDVHDALCFALWHHQGGSSTIGQPIRKMLDLGPHDHMDKDEIAGAKRVQSALEAQRKPLTNEQIDAVWDVVPQTQFWWRSYARAIEAKLKEKNT
jgi:hypothetical protein